MNIFQFGWNPDRSGKEIAYVMRSKENKDIAFELKNTNEMGREDEDNRLWRYDKRAGKYEADKMIKNNEEHICKDKDITNIDENKENDSHIHNDLEKSEKNKKVIINKDTIDEKTKEIIENFDKTENKDFYTEKEIKEALSKKLKDGTEHSVEEVEKIADDVEDELEADAEMLNKHR